MCVSSSSRLMSATLLWTNPICVDSTGSPQASAGAGGIDRECLAWLHPLVCYWCVSKRTQKRASATRCVLGSAHVAQGTWQAVAGRPDSASPDDNTIMACPVDAHARSHPPACRLPGRRAGEAPCPPSRFAAEGHPYPPYAQPLCVDAGHLGRFPSTRSLTAVHQIHGRLVR